MRDGSRLLFVLLLSLRLVSSLNILMFVPTLSYSHVAFNGKVADTLISNGHHVVMLLSVIDPSIQFNGSSKATVLRADVGFGRNVLSTSLWHNPGPFEDSSPLNHKIFRKLIRVSGLFIRACRALAEDTALFEQLSSMKFDVGVVEQYDACGFGVFASLGIPSTVWLSATAVFRIQPEVIGVNYPLSYVPEKCRVLLYCGHSELFSPVTDRMGVIEKITNMLIGSVTGLVYSMYSRAEETRIFRRKGVLAGDASILGISQQSHSVIINSQPLFDFPMPMSSQIGHVAGITIDPHVKPLSSEWQSIADSSSGGFILVTFGSIAKTTDMPPNLFAMFIQAFRRFPDISFILKHEATNGSVIHADDNLYLTNWLPQIPLMAHRNFKAIITHGGWSSILESVYFGKPMILMPLFGDHAKNSKVVEAKGVGLLIDKLSLSTTVLETAIRQITENPIYTETCERYSKLLKEVGPVGHGDLLNHHFKRAAKMANGKHMKYMTPKEATLNFFIVKGVDLVALFAILLIGASI